MNKYEIQLFSSETKILKVAGYSLNRTKMTLLEGGVDGFSFHQNRPCYWMIIYKSFISFFHPKNLWWLPPQTNLTQDPFLGEIKKIHLLNHRTISQRTWLEYSLDSPRPNKIFYSLHRIKMNIFFIFQYKDGMIILTLTKAKPDTSWEVEIQSGLPRWTIINVLNYFLVRRYAGRKS
jgi:hypothetical protein